MMRKGRVLTDWREHTGVIEGKGSNFQGEFLKLTKVTRSEMGAYLCIASNGIPPSVSKRIMVSVHFHPVIQVPNQLVGAPLGTDVTLECHVEASPRSINYWVRDTGEMVISSDKYDVQTISKSMFEVKMIMNIRSPAKTDVGSYLCVAKNSLGEVDSSIRLYDEVNTDVGLLESESSELSRAYETDSSTSTDIDAAVAQFKEQIQVATVTWSASEVPLTIALDATSSNRARLALLATLVTTVIVCNTFLIKK